MIDLAGKLGIVTGAASGIGRASALALARAGVRIIAADIDIGGAQATAAKISDEGGSARAMAIDVAQEDAFATLGDGLAASGDVPDIVMNNVGVITRGLPDHVPNAEWERILNVNVMSVVRSISAFLPAMLARGSGHFVNTASFAGLFTYSYDRLPYAAAKAAVIQLSEGLALYLKPRGLGVTCLCPGPVRTNIMSSLRAFGPPTDTLGPGPEFALLDPEIVGEMVVDAIRNDRFMLPTHDEVVPKLVARATDWDGFLDAQVTRPFVVARARPGND